MKLGGNHDLRLLGGVGGDNVGEIQSKHSIYVYEILKEKIKTYFKIPKWQKFLNIANVYL